MRVRARRYDVRLKADAVPATEAPYELVKRCASSGWVRWSHASALDASAARRLSDCAARSISTSHPEAPERRSGSRRSSSPKPGACGGTQIVTDMVTVTGTENLMAAAADGDDHRERRRANRGRRFMQALTAMVHASRAQGRIAFRSSAWKGCTEPGTA
jgi:hypothetical protein